MRKNIAIYLALFSVLLAGVSCGNNNDDIYTVSGTPYAFISSFRIGNIKCPYHAFTADGRDTIVERVVTGEAFEFVVDQKAKEVYNVDSLVYGTKVDKVVSNVSCTGIPYRYDLSSDAYVYYSSTDSVDFTSPVSVRITSSDGTYDNYYTIKLNVHRVDPDLMVWESFAAPALEGVVPVKIIEHDGKMYLFGTDAGGAPVVAVSSVTGEPEWVVTSLSLSAACDLSSVQLFNEKFYMLVAGDVYTSGDAVSWALSSAGNAFVSLFAVSDNGGRLWAASETDIFSSADGTAFLQAQPLPEGFPLYGVCSISSTLSTNESISRTMLIGFSSADKAGAAQVWCRLSNDNEWYAYELTDNKYPCPAFAGLTVVGYDDALYAMGGTALIDGVQVKAFDKFYVSRDNGVVWKPCTDYATAMPAGLKGNEEPFAATVSQDDYMWIVTSAAVWRGRINRLGFNK